MSNSFDKPSLEIHGILVVGKSQVNNTFLILKKAESLGLKMHVVWRENARPSNHEFSLCQEFEIENCSLSSGRNLVLQNVLNSSNIPRDSIFFLADDDGGLPDDFVHRIEQVFSRNIDWALGLYAPDELSIDWKRFSKFEMTELSQRDILKLSCSLGIYARLSLIRQVGLFNEELGLGTHIPVGEDTEYALRLKNVAKNSFYSPRLMQFHPYKQKSKDYQLQSLRFLLYLSMQSPIFLFSTLRRMLKLSIIKGLGPRLVLKEVFHSVIHFTTKN